MRQQSVGEWKWVWTRGDRRLACPFTFHGYKNSPHRYAIRCGNQFSLATLILRWSPTPEEIATYLNMAEVYYADDIQQERNHV